MVIRSYESLGGRPLGEWAGYDGVELAFGEHGPDVASLSLPAGSAHLAASALFPGGRSVFLEIDATDTGIYGIWTGRVVGLDGSSQGGTRGVSLKGPELWLGQVSAPAMMERHGAAGRLLRELHGVAEAPLWFDIGTAHEGKTAPLALNGETWWDLLSGMADERGEEFFFTARPGRVSYRLDWTSPFASLTVPHVTLEEGWNCEWDMAYSFDQTAEEMTGVGLSIWDVRGTASAVGVRSSAGLVTGRRAALLAGVHATTVRTLAGQGLLNLSPIGGRARMEYALEAALRRYLSPILTLQVKVLDQDLWPHLRPGVLVNTRMPSEDTGVYQSGVGRVRTVTARVTPPYGMNLSMELWSA